MSGYFLGHDAAADLEDIWDYIAADSVAAADRWVETLFDAFEALANSPGMGHLRQDLTREPLLFWPVGAYLIIYRTTLDALEIVAVTQGSRDIPVLLNRRQS